MSAIVAPACAKPAADRVHHAKHGHDRPGDDFQAVLERSGGPRSAKITARGPVAPSNDLTSEPQPKQTAVPAGPVTPVARDLPVRPQPPTQRGGPDGKPVSRPVAKPDRTSTEARRRESPAPVTTPTLTTTALAPDIAGDLLPAPTGNQTMAGPAALPSADMSAPTATPAPATQARHDRTASLHHPDAVAEAPASDEILPSKPDRQPSTEKASSTTLTSDAAQPATAVTAASPTVRDIAAALVATSGPVPEPAAHSLGSGVEHVGVGQVEVGHVEIGPVEIGHLEIGQVGPATGGRPGDLSVRLSLPHLGTVEVRLSKDDSTGSAMTISADRPETLRAMITDEAQLRSVLAGTGLEGDKRPIEYTLLPASDPAGGGSFTPSGEQHRRREGGEADARPGSDGSEFDPRALLSMPVGAGAHLSNAIVNITA